jgi:hypothetical protein
VHDRAFLYALGPGGANRLMSMSAAARLLLALVLAVAASGTGLLHGDLVLGAGCTVTIGTSVDRVDGASEGRIGPGAIVCLAAGRRGNIKLFNLRGTADNPVTVRNEGGPVTISGTKFGDGGIIIGGSSFLRLTGSGTTHVCGAEYDVSEQACGIAIDGAKKGIKIVTDKGSVHDLEIDHVAVLRVSQKVKTRGILIHPLPGQLISGLHIHHNFVTNTLAEGIYLGSEPHGKPFASLAKLERVEVDHNLVKDVGFDGIKIKVAVADVSVHDNVILNAGISRTPAHQGGIKLAMSVGDYYSNTIVGAVEGIRMGRTIPSAKTRYFNNLVASVVDVGIEADEAGAQVFNNMVVSSAGAGIRATGKGASVSRNVVVSAAVPLDVTRGTATGNVVLRLGQGS